MEPIFNVIEMDTPLDQIVPKLRKAGYPRDIQNADVARAIAAYRIPSILSAMLAMSATPLQAIAF